MSKGNFWSRHRAATDAGLNAEWALKVAYGCIELDEALGAMDHDAESRGEWSDILHTPIEHDCGCRGSASCKDCIPF